MAESRRYRDHRNDVSVLRLRELPCRVPEHRRVLPIVVGLIDYWRRPDESAS